MIPLALVLLPVLAGATAFALRSHPARRLLLVGTAGAHLLLCGAASWTYPAPGLPGWLEADRLGLLFLVLTSLLFLAAAVYAVGYLRRESPRPRPDLHEPFLFVNAPEAVFTGCLLLFLATMTLVCLSRRFGLLWVAIEATTLASAPLIYFHRHHRSLEATWKYLLLCSVGIALALLGTFFLALATVPGGGERPTPLVLEALLARGPGLNFIWLKVAFLFLLVGYGTKAGLAPLHCWLPDAHSEAPSVVSALLSGALLNCAFLGILRVYQVCLAAGLGAFARQQLLGFGLLSMAVAAVFILGQVDYKRLLAYSSVEHVGILAVAFGLAGGAGAALLHAINHSLTKAMLFLLAGNILAVTRTTHAPDVRGLRHSLPWTGTLWLAGFLAISGSPPFGTFVSEFLILRTAFSGGHWLVGTVFLLCLAVAFVGMATLFLRMSQGAPAPTGLGPVREPLSTRLPPLLLGLPVLTLGLYLPPVLTRFLDQAALALGG